jgi:hypothetical protein
MVLLGRVDAGTTLAATNSQWVFQTSVDVTLLLLLLMRPASENGHVARIRLLCTAIAELFGWESSTFVGTYYS